MKIFLIHGLAKSFIISMSLKATHRFTIVAPGNLPVISLKFTRITKGSKGFQMNQVSL